MFAVLNMERLPLVAVVILNWNGKDFLSRFLPPLLASTYKNVKFFVADNASTDDSVAFIRDNFPQVHLIVHSVNYGFAKGYNEALGQIKADYYLLLNSDVLVSAGWIQPLVNIMETHSRIAACQPKILSYHERHTFEYAGACGGWLDRFGYPFCRGRVFDVCEKDDGQYDQATPVFWASGAAMIVRASVFQEVGGFDDYFFAHQEEIDLCWRIQRAGYLVYVQPKSTVYHVGGGTLPMGSKKKLYLNFRNNLVLMSKNLKPGEAIPKVFSRMTLDLIASVRGFLTGDKITPGAVHSAHIDYCLWLFRRKNRIKLPKIKFSNLAGTYEGSVVWQFFIAGRKTFSEIVRLKK